MRKSILAGLVAAAIGGGGLLTGSASAQTAAGPDGNLWAWTGSFTGASCAWSGDDLSWSSTHCGNFNNKASSLHNRGFDDGWGDVIVYDNGAPDTGSGGWRCIPNGSRFSLKPVSVPGGNTSYPTFNDGSRLDDDISGHRWVRSSTC
ncbi:hypothetical protein ACIBH1_23170 [Nonomuraea sp. NPDC050663]|uniref:hypothetical protein n=1 Tax=Nonomuraea sp. NPDC050663 TaxID=3364370 RepID=UPI0037AD8433